MIKDLYILGEITDETCVKFSQELSNAISQGATKIRVKINSGGGSVISALSIFDELEAVEVETEAIILGICASAATYPTLACNKILMQKSASFMIHRCHGGVRGTLEEMENDLDYFEEMENKVIALYAAKSGKTSEEIIAMMDATTYMNAEQALANGFVDEVVGRDSALFNVADVEILNSIEVEEQPKNLIEKVVDIFTSKEKKEEETLQNKLTATENKVIELTNEIEALKVSHDAAIVELNNIIDNYKQKEQELIESFDNRVADEVNTRIANLGIDTELPDASNEISEIDFSNCKSISDYWKQLGY